MNWLTERLNVGDWVLANLGLRDEIKLRRLAAGPEFRRDPRGFVTTEVWELDDGHMVERKHLVRSPIDTIAEAASLLAHRIERYEIGYTAGDRLVLDRAYADATVNLRTMRESYPGKPHANRPPEIVAAITALHDLVKAIEAWREMPQRLLCLATSIGWGAVLCAAERRGVEACRTVLTHQALTARQIELKSSMLDGRGGVHPQWMAGYINATDDAIQAIDRVLNPTKETEGHGERERGDQEPDGAGGEPGGPDRAN